MRPSRKLRGTTHLYLWSAWVLGGLTLLFRDETFILWKPTIVNWIFCGVCLALSASQIHRSFSSCLANNSHSPRGLVQVGLWLELGFFIAGALNLIVAYNFSLDFWMAYKLVGGLGSRYLYGDYDGVSAQARFARPVGARRANELSSKPKE